jgi:hypothetical protein
MNLKFLLYSAFIYLKNGLSWYVYANRHKSAPFEETDTPVWDAFCITALEAKSSDVTGISYICSKNV